MAERASAFLLFGGLVLFRRHPRLLDAIAERGLALLLIVEPGVGGGADLDAAIADPDDRLHRVAELRTVRGSDRAALTETVADLAGTYRIVGSFCIGEGLVEPAGLVAAMLDLPAPGLLASTVCRNKLLQRRLLADYSPGSVALLPGERDAGIRRYVDGWPAVLKPAGRFSSSGVMVVESPDAVRAVLAGSGTYDETELLLLEPRVEGAEYSVEALVRAGEVEYLGITGKETNETGTDHFVEMAHTVPALDSAERDDVLVASRDVLRRLRFETGVAHLEWRVSPSGPVLMEVAARMPGDGLALLHTLATGESFEDAVLRLALGERSGYPGASRWVRQRYLEARPGTLTGVHAPTDVEVHWVHEPAYWPTARPRDAAAAAELRMICMTKPVNTVVGEFRSSADRFGWLCLDAPSVPELLRLDTEVANVVVADTTPAGDGALR